MILAGSVVANLSGLFPSFTHPGREAVRLSWAEARATQIEQKIRANHWRYQPALLSGIPSPGPSGDGQSARSSQLLRPLRCGFEVTAAGPGSKGAIERDKPRHRMEPHMSNDLSLAQNHCPDTDGPGYPL